MESARNPADKLETLQQDFKTHQLAIMDRTNEEDALVDEQQVLDDNDDQVSELSVRIQCLITLATKSKSLEVAREANRQLTLLQAKLKSIDTAIHDLDNTEEDIACIFEGYRNHCCQSLSYQISMVTYCSGRTSGRSSASQFTIEQPFPRKKS